MALCLPQTAATAGIPAKYLQTQEKMVGGEGLEPTTKAL